ncbi:hypothetical protein CK203_075955 [Vitis vinifera]|uniref:Uncharacterized protein n=1 Tax=Vitis vinifera TaxID=29760 RepID=A0A438C1S4_VITVI|nr:hypothetical protein CK203_075955 [Vitis vinifera]
MVTPMVQNVQPHLVVRQAGKSFPNEPPIGSISKRLDDMLSMPFYSHIIHYEPQGDSSSSSEASVQASHFSNHSLKSLQQRWNDLFRRANKYSMLEDDVRAATQQVLVVGQASRSGADRNAKLPDRPRPSDRRQEGPGRPERPPLTPLSISYEKLLPMIQGMSDFRWPRPLGTDPSKRDHSKKCAFHNEHGHTTEECRCLHYLVKRLIRAGHLKQYLRSDAGGRDNTGAPKAPAAPKAVINYINGCPFDEEYDSK